jgi:hypothetical protein
MHRLRDAVVPTRAAVPRVARHVRLTIKAPVAIRIDPACVAGARREDGALTDDHAAHAGARAGLARSGRSCGRGLRDVAFADGVRGRGQAREVDRPVTVVVEAVARLDARIDLPHARERSARAHELPERAWEDVARPACSAGIDGSLVDAPVAVVVDAVASFWLLPLGEKVRPGARHDTCCTHLEACVSGRGTLTVRSREADGPDRRSTGEVVRAVDEPIAELPPAERTG